MKTGFIAFYLLFIFSINSYSQQQNTHLRPLIRQHDTNIKKDTGENVSYIDKAKAAIDAQEKAKLTPFKYEPKTWYEYINFKSWIMIGFAVLLLVAWIWRQIAKK